MLRCPFCHFDNEDGALFCEQCKSDLAGVEAPAVPVAETIPVAAVVESAPIAEVVDLPAGAVIGEPVAEIVEASSPLMETVPVAPIVPAPAPVVEPAPAPEPPLAVAPPAPPPPAPPAPPPAPPAIATAPAPAPAAPAVEAGELPAGAQPRLLVLRGQKRNVEYPIYEGQNFIGRADEKPVDIDLEDQEPPDRIWSSRQHALITFEGNRLHVEDLNSSNGTFVNRVKIYPAQPRPLNVNDVIQIGTVQLKVIV
jgi:hypothetical protein